MKLARFSVGRPVFTTMVTLIVVIIGAVALQRLPIDLMPDVADPTLTVRTEYENAAPQEVEELITRQVEQAVAAVPGVQELTSISAEGRSDVRVTFGWGSDLDVAANDIRDRLDRIMDNVPEEATRPQLRKFDAAAFPILVFGISSRLDPIALRTFVEDNVLYRLERLPGVATVEIFGGLEREVRVEVDADRIKALDLPLDRILEALKAANVNLPAGGIERGALEVTVRAPGHFRDLEELKDTIVAMRSGAPIRLRQIARVSDTHKKATRLIRINGEPGVRLGVRKQSGTNTVEVARRVLKEAERVNADYPQIRMVPVTDTSAYIQRSIDNVRSTVLWGGALAVVVLLLFLRDLRSTFVIATAIPISILATFALLYFGGFTLNLMTLGGLALGVGMMVDNAIVVLENIVRVRAEETPDRKEAAVAGTTQVWAAIVASTLTTLVVFLPLVFVRGQTGLLFRQLGYVVSFSLVCSLLVALTLVPMLAARVMAKGEGSGRGILWRLVGKGLHAIEEAYQALLAGAIRWRWVVLPLVALLLWGSLELSNRLGTEFLPASDEGEVRVTAEMEVGTRIEVVDKEVAEIERIVREEVPEALHTTVSIGPSYRSATAASGGEIRVTLVPAKERKRSSEEIAVALRKRLALRPGMVVRARAGQGLFVLRIGFEEENALVVDIRGHEFETLHQVAAEVQKAIESVPGVVDVRLSSQAGAPETLLRIDRDRAADLGLTVSKLAQTLETAIAGSDAGDYREGGDEVRILLKVEGSERMAIDQILDFTITNDRAEQVVLRNVVEADPHKGPVVIDRKNQQRVVIATAGIEGRDLGSVARDVQEALRRIPMPKGYETALAGDFEEQQEAFGELVMGLLLSLVLVYMVMACLYESLVDPLVVMFSVPLALIGVVVTLFLTGTTFNVQSFIGCIMLGGIVVNNAILIVDQASALRREGRGARDAVLEAGRRRLRPILMTTLTTVLGLLPLALGIGEGAEAQAPMARAVVGGLTSSTLITLVVVPIVYLLAERFRAPFDR
ncbi:MAG TPA: efflux RND transporter permease subunit [Planctomycetota bacterium]|nr:efflux RND transporter permease subunit [Planctomycetota bacterium]